MKPVECMELATHQDANWHWAAQYNEMPHVHGATIPEAVANLVVAVAAREPKP